MWIDPFRSMREMERMFDESIGRYRQGMGAPAAGMMVAPVDVCESQDEFLIRCMMPGVRPDDVDVTVHQDTVTIRGQMSVMTDPSHPEGHVHIIQGQPGQSGQETEQRRGRGSNRKQQTKDEGEARQGQQQRGQEGDHMMEEYTEAPLMRQGGGDWQCLIREIPTGRFSRTITLNAPVSPDKAEARFDHGILTLRLPKAEESRPKQIRVRGE